jgi:hypothetical protein
MIWPKFKSAIIIESQIIAKIRKSTSNKWHKNNNNSSCDTSTNFVLSFSIGHRGAYGHEFLDFELDSTGKLKYHNNSEYKSDQLIRKQGNLMVD